MTQHTHHPVFDAIGNVVSFIGAPDPRLQGWDGNAPPLTDAPPFNDEYFEWVDLVDALRTAGDRFVMCELGAGYGRWGLRAGLMARKLSKSVTIRFVEAEPQHAQWAREAIAANGFDTSEMTVIEAAINYEGSPVLFCIRNELEGLDATNWYGQQTGWGEGAAPTAETYFGKPVYLFPNSYYPLIKVDAVTLEQITADLDQIDLVDMDLQSAEKEVVLNSMPTLIQKVRRIHVETHSLEIDEIVRDAFLASGGWLNAWTFACDQLNDTPYGKMQFHGGISSWINTRLESGSSAFRALPSDSLPNSLKPYDETRRVVYGEATCIGSTKLSIRTQAGRWHHAVEFPLETVGLDPHTRLRVTLKITVHRGSAGLGILLADRSSLPEEVCVNQSTEPSVIELISEPISNSGPLLVRNINADGGSELEMEIVDIGVLNYSTQRRFE